MVTAADKQPRILMIPVTAETGSGEYYRSLTIAHGLQARLPAAQIEFILNRRSHIEHDRHFHAYYIDGPPSLNTPAVNEILETCRPDIAVFDGAGRIAQMRHASQLGCRTVFVSSRPGKRRRGFRWRAMRHIDQHWIAQSGFFHRLSRWERFKLGNPPRTDIRFLSALFPEPEPHTRSEVLVNLGIDPDKPYLLFAPGGGGWRIQGVPAGEVFAEAARLAARETGMQTIALYGPQYQGRIPEIPGVITHHGLNAPGLINLMYGAQVIGTGTGSIAMQALALKLPGAFALTGGSDQPARHRLIGQLQLGLPVETTAQALCNGVVRLCNDHQLRELCQANIKALGLKNDLPVAISALESLLNHPVGAAWSTNQ